MKLPDGQNEEQLAHECDGEEMKMAKEEAGLDLKRQKTMLSHYNRLQVISKMKRSMMIVMRRRRIWPLPCPLRRRQVWIKTS